MSDPGCVFCGIVSGERPCHHVYGDAEVLAFMDAYPSCDGHVLVIPRLHRESIFDLEDAEAAAVAVTARRVACAMYEALSPDGLNVTQANGEAAGQTVAHYHVHLLPRTAGVRLDHHAARAGDPERLADLARRIAACL